MFDDGQFQKQVEIAFNPVFALHEGLLAIHLAPADTQPDFGGSMEGNVRGI